MTTYATRAASAIGTWNARNPLGANLPFERCEWLLRGNLSHSQYESRELEEGPNTADPKGRFKEGLC